VIIDKKSKTPVTAKKGKTTASKKKVKELPSDVYRIEDFRKQGQGRNRKSYVTTAHASQIKLFNIVNEDEFSDDDELSDDED